MDDETPVVRCRLRRTALDARISRTVPDALLLVDERRGMLCLRFRHGRDLYDLTEFVWDMATDRVTFDRDEYTRLLFWLREEHNALTTQKG